MSAVLHNKYPCCNQASGIKHKHWNDDAVLDKVCRKCGSQFLVTFEQVQPFEYMAPFRKVVWTRLTWAGGRPMTKEDVQNE